MYEEVRQHLQHLEQCGIIQRSCSPWAAPVVLALKSSDKLRMCIDYRQLNLKTIKDSYALPRLEDITDNFVCCDLFSSLDMRSGYYQVEINEADKAKIAFTTGPMGFYEFVCMPFGLCNAPATFQRLMKHCMGELYMKCCFAYIDDINVPSAGFDQGLQRLEQVFFRNFVCIILN